MKIIQLTLNDSPFHAQIVTFKTDDNEPPRSFSCADHFELVHRLRELIEPNAAIIHMNKEESL